MSSELPDKPFPRLCLVSDLVPVAAKDEDRLLSDSVARLGGGCEEPGDDVETAEAILALVRDSIPRRFDAPAATDSDPADGAAADDTITDGDEEFPRLTAALRGVEDEDGQPITDDDP